MEDQTYTQNHLKRTIFHHFDLMAVYKYELLIMTIT